MSTVVESHTVQTHTGPEVKNDYFFLLYIRNNNNTLLINAIHNSNRPLSCLLWQ